ncbi:hypothetical protein [Actinoallomurus sp. NPDC050550]|uniref:hypothetical protein n=1 Tax=Actinoallomurus sp. NPDC050550 TaxID=3154937 RepID=UPI0033EEFC9F
MTTATAPAPRPNRPLTVPDRAALDGWTRHLDALGVSRSPVRDTGYAEFVSVPDPDGIAWELWAAKPEH